MNINLLNFIFNWITAVAGIVAAIGAVGSLLISKTIEKQKDEKIRLLQDEIIELAPRSITTEQSQQLLKLLARKKGRVGFLVKVFNDTSKEFAIQLSTIFREAGWQVEEPINQTLLDDYDGRLNIFTDEANPAQIELANLIVNSLNEAGFPIGPQPIRDNSFSGHFSKEAVYILVDSKKTK